MTDKEFLEKTASGAVRIYSDGECVHLCRFTEEQQNAYKNNPDFYEKANATSGVILDFKTSAENISFDYFVTRGSSRRYYYFDVYVNGIMTHHTGGEYSVPTTGTFSAELPSGEKTVKIYFPQLACAAVKNISLAQTEDFISLKNRYEGKALFFGDSITQGYDAYFPSMSYPAIFCRKKNYEFVNRAIGGDIHFADIIKKEDYDPDKIFVAYGTNDWSHLPSVEVFRENIERFYQALTSVYPESSIYAITPIRRLDDTPRNCGEFRGVHHLITEITSKYENVSVLDGYDFVGAAPDLFSDKKLHPNDLGFTIYADSLAKLF